MTNVKGRFKGRKTDTKAAVWGVFEFDKDFNKENHCTLMLHAIG